MKKEIRLILRVPCWVVALLCSCTSPTPTKKNVEPVVEQAISYKDLYGEACFKDTVLDMDLQIVNSKNKPVLLSGVVGSLFVPDRRIW